jgi:serine/threonine protein phosphatase 1
MSTYVVSDLHGQFDIFMGLLEKAGFSESDTLYMLGDAIDRGPESIKILHYVMNSPNMEFLLGNHELMMLTSVDPNGSATSIYGRLPGRNAELWLRRNGGNKTYYKYKLLKKEQRLEILEWLNSRPLLKTVTVNGQTFLLTHSYFELNKLDVPYKELDYMTARKILWMSPFRRDLYIDPSEYKALSPWKVVLGHVPVHHIDPSSRELAPLSYGNIIDIDGCCAHSKRKENAYKGGILLRLDDLQVFTCTFEE